MRKLTILGLSLGAVTYAGCAIAADAPVAVAPIAPYVAAPLWTGFYFGAHAGGGREQQEVHRQLPDV